METVEQMLDRLQRLDERQRELQSERESLIRRIKDAPKDSWDWISVKTASDILGRSVSFIYAKINAGKLSAIHQGSCVNVRESEVKAMDDSYRYKEAK